MKDPANMKLEFVKRNDCPVCHNAIDCATNPEAGRNTPIPGDYCACVHCYTLLKYGPKLDLELMSEEEMAQVPTVIKEHLAELRADLESLKKLLKRFGAHGSGGINFTERR